ncbi:MAG: DUF1846 family protein, partial [Bacilli bacterium]|nr:DUF1846 family protein [Bacilli bacterium]
SRDEIVRRYLKALVDFRMERIEESTVSKIDSLMKQLGLSIEDRRCITAAKEKAQKTGRPAAAIELNDGTIITGKTSDLLGAMSACLLNALKYLAGISDRVYLLPKAIIEPICDLKTKDLGGHNPRLHTDETLIALAISAITNPLAELAMAQLPKLRGAQSHTSVILSQVDDSTLRKLGIDHTSDAVYGSKKLYHAK